MTVIITCIKCGYVWKPVAWRVVTSKETRGVAPCPSCGRMNNIPKEPT